MNVDQGRKHVMEDWTFTNPNKRSLSSKSLTEKHYWGLMKVPVNPHPLIIRHCLNQSIFDIYVLKNTIQNYR